MIKFLRNKFLILLKTEKIKLQKSMMKKIKFLILKNFFQTIRKLEAHKYFLEGNVIKLYLVENGIKIKCLKRIALKDADASILAQIENVSPEELRIIVQMQQDERKKDETEEYSIYDTRSYLRNLK